MHELALLQAGVPLAVSLWLLFGHPVTWGDLAARVIGGWILLVGVALAGLWLALPFSTLVPLAAFMFIASLVATRRVRKGRSRTRRPFVTWTSRIIVAGFLGLGGWLAVPALAGRSLPDGAVDLSFPMRGGRYLVINGGSSERVNGHMMTLGNRYAAWRGESYAVDLIRIDTLGFRTRRRQLLAPPGDPADYLSYGEPVYAPCAGRVEAVMDQRPDMRVPIRDRKHLEGNFVRVRCGNATVFLGHLRHGSVVIKTGDPIANGALVGRVGNSGNTDEPHLHIHVQKPVSAGAPLSGQPLHITFDGRFPVRNMIFG